MPEQQEQAIIKADPFTTPDHYDPKVMAQAYDMFLNRALSLDDIALMVAVDRGVIAKWAKRGRWMDRKKALEQELMQSVEFKHRQWELTKRFEEAESQLAKAKELQNTIMETLAAMKNGQKTSVTDMQIKRLSEALQACANVGARAVGLGLPDGNQPGQAGNRMGGGSTKQPLIILGVKPSLPAPGDDRGEGRGIVIDVESREVDV